MRYWLVLAVPWAGQLTAWARDRTKGGQGQSIQTRGKVAPIIEVSPGEHLILRITAVRAREVARDGSVHGLALLDKDENVVPGWRFYLHPGVQELDVTAPPQPGHYTAVCIVICSDMHEDMGFTLVVTPLSAK